MRIWSSWVICLRYAYALRGASILAVWALDNIGLDKVKYIDTRMPSKKVCHGRYFSILADTENMLNNFEFKGHLQWSEKLIDPAWLPITTQNAYINDCFVKSQSD